MATVNFYLTFDGNCKSVFEFYRSVLGGEFDYIGTFGEMSSSEGMEVSEADKDRIMHVSLPISKETRLMGSDTSETHGPAFIKGNNFSISFNVDSKDEADRVFQGLSDGGEVTMPMQKTFWSDYFGMFTDKYGINWMVSMDEEENNY